MSFSPIVGQKVLALKTPFNPPAIGIIEGIRGDGSLQVVEVKILPGQPGALLRIAGIGQWQLFSNAEGGEAHV